MIFTDKLGREIEIEVDVDRASASHEGKEIGFVDTTGLQDDDERMPMKPAFITGWEVDSNYRRAGIAVAMVRALVEELGTLLPPDKNIGIGDINALTDDGEHLTRHCQEHGLIAKFSDERPDREDD